MSPKKTPPGSPQAVAGDGMTPPADDATAPLVTWLKLAPRTRIQCYVCSSTWFGAQTHWAGGHMKFHTSPTCRWCEAKSPIRFHAFLHLCGLKEKREYLVQLSAGNAGTLIRARDQYRVLRGCKVELAKPGPATNSPTVISFLTAPTGIDNLPPELNIRYKLGFALNAHDVPMTDADQPRLANL